MRSPLLLVLPLLLASCGSAEPETSRSTSDASSVAYDAGGGSDQEPVSEPTDDEPSRSQPAAAQDDDTPPREDCDRSYPDFCIPPPPPDLDCKDVSGPKPFRVRRPDPHNFDRDGDGKACEPNPRRRRN